MNFSRYFLAYKSSEIVKKKKKAWYFFYKALFYLVLSSIFFLIYKLHGKLNRLIICPGAFGVDFSDTDGDIVTGVRSVAKRLLEHGVTSFCPTVITSPPDAYQKVSAFA